MKYSKKGLAKRKEDRAGFAEFFQECVEEIKKNKLCCVECGAPLKGDVSEVAHVLPKSYFKSVAMNKQNWLPMCGMWSTENQCHYKFDNSNKEVFKSMKIYTKVQELFYLLESIIEEKISYKIYDRYTDE